MYSFDAADVVWRNKDKEIGYATKTMYPNGNKQWQLFVNSDFSQYADSLDVLFDMVIIDTMHIHPIETLNFLSVLPYLSDGAVVVFHDLALYTIESHHFNKFPQISLANKLAFDAIVGEKLYPVDGSYLRGTYGFSNIGAVQVSNETRKYIGNLFDMLSFPWGVGFFGIWSYLTDVLRIIKKHYSANLYIKFCTALRVNINFTSSQYSYIPNAKSVLPQTFVKNNSKFIFYGAGENCQQALQLFKMLDLPNPVEIWDARGNHAKVCAIKPRFSDIAANIDDFKDAVFVITIGDENIVKSVKERFLSINKEIRVIVYCEYRDVFARPCLNRILEYADQHF